MCLYIQKFKNIYKYLYNIYIEYMKRKVKKKKKKKQSNKKIYFFLKKKKK